MKLLVAMAPSVGWIVLALTLASVVLLLSAARRTRNAGKPASVPLSRSREATWLLLILVETVLSRTLWYASVDLPRFSAAATTPLWVASFVDQGRLGRQVLDSLYTTQVGWEFHSAVMLPVAAGFQAALGPSIQLPTLVGAFWGVLAVVLAWLLGRTVRSPRFGLLFAALVAASPLQITWARLGGLQVGSTAHVLLLTWIAYLAGSRASTPLALLAGVVGWTSLYHYYAARAGLLLAPAALWAGTGATRRPTRVTARLLALFVLGMGMPWALAHGGDPWDVMWPKYPTYVGSRDERTAVEFVAAAAGEVRQQLPDAARAYFWRGRMFDRYFGVTGVPSGTALDPRMSSGGLCLLPVAALGVVGLVVALRNRRRDALWLLLAAVGFLLPSLSLPSARRFLVFDLAWCALAAGGLMALIDGDRRGARVPMTAALVSALALGGWAFGTVLALASLLPPFHNAVIPFGESGFGDGRTCLACVRAGRDFQQAIAAGDVVVLFDTDVQRETPFNPGGLALYGKLGALTAGRPGRFASYYAIVGNVDHVPPARGRLYDDARTSAVAYLADLVADAEPTTIRWYFARPTQWERSLASRLETSGGTRRLIEDPARALRPPGVEGPGFEIRTPATRVPEALDIVAAATHERSRDPRERSCLTLQRIAETPTVSPPLWLADAPRRDGAPPRWIVGSWHTVSSEDGLPHGETVAGEVEAAGSGVERLRLVNWRGFERVLDAANAPEGSLRQVGMAPVGLDCAAFADAAWWIVDPVSGGLSTTMRAGELPPGPFIGVARADERRLILGAPDQSLQVFDLETRRTTQRFSAVVPPSRRFLFGECSPVLVGAGWIATFDHLRSRLFVYDTEGTPLGEVALDRMLELPAHGITAVHASGAYLGVAHAATVVTFRVDLRPDCRGPHAPTRSP